jgi:hypothetical protein
LNILLSNEAVSSDCASNTLKFMGQIQGHTVVLLVDYGSSHSFINSCMSGVLAGVVQVPDPIRVKVANGQIVTCTSEIRQAAWYIQDNKFVANLKVIPLPYYDIILGIDWLQQHSPMNIVCLNKWVILQSNGNSIILHGLQPSVPAFSLIEVQLLADADSDSETIGSQHPKQIAKLLLSFSGLFQEPTDLPPIRACDHTIPLIPGAEPINIRPYRFSPTMKTEIEHQIQDMLNKGLIQHNRSAFSSLVLLVKKKDVTSQP